MVRSFVRHDVAEYDDWREVYDRFHAGRIPGELGVRGQAVYQSVDDPNDVTVTHDFVDADTARMFFASSELRIVMEEAGVRKDGMQLWITGL